MTDKEGQDVRYVLTEKGERATEGLLGKAHDLAQTIVEDAVQHALDLRLATALARCVAVWRDNDPLDSVSNSTIGIQTRKVRRTEAIAYYALLMDVTQAQAEIQIIRLARATKEG